MAGSETRDAESWDSEEPMRKSTPSVNWKPVIGLVVIVALTAFGLANAQLVGREVARLVRWSKRLGPWAAVLMFALSALMPVIMLPAFPLMALSGPLFTQIFNSWLVGGTVAFGSVFSGLWCGSVIAFALGKTVLKSYSERLSESDTMRRINRIIEKGGVKILLLAKASPMLPGVGIDYACSITSLSAWQYAVSCLGSAVPVAFWTFSSAQAAAAARTSGSGSGASIWLIVINVIALALLTALLARMIGHEEAAPVIHTSPAVETFRRASASFAPANFAPTMLTPRKRMDSTMSTASTREDTWQTPFLERSRTAR